MRDLYSNDVETAADLAAFEELPAECDQMMDDYSDLEHLRQRGYFNVPVGRDDFLARCQNVDADVPF